MMLAQHGRLITVMPIDCKDDFLKARTSMSILPHQKGTVTIAKGAA